MEENSWQRKGMMHGECIHQINEPAKEPKSSIIQTNFQRAEVHRLVHSRAQKKAQEKSHRAQTRRLGYAKAQEEKSQRFEAHRLAYSRAQEQRAQEKSQRIQTRRLNYAKAQEAKSQRAQTRRWGYVKSQEQQWVQEQQRAQEKSKLDFEEFDVLSSEQDFKDIYGMAKNDFVTRYTKIAGVMGAKAQDTKDVNEIIKFVTNTIYIDENDMTHKLTSAEAHLIWDAILNGDLY